MTDTFQPSPLAEVRADAAGETRTLVFVRDLKHPPETVWAALTEPDRVGAWAPYTTDRDLGTPGEATLTMIDGDVAEPSAATVIRAEPPRLLEYSWGGDRLRWELEPTDTAEAGSARLAPRDDPAKAAGTRLTLRHTVSDPEWLPKVAAGWHLCLDVAERLLGGAPIPPIRGSDALNYGWQELADAYAKRLA